MTGNGQAVTAGADSGCVVPTVDVLTDAETGRLCVCGELRSGTVMAIERLDSRLIGRRQDWLIDLSKVAGIDSSALALVLSWQRQLLAAGVSTVRVVNVPETFRSVARLCGLDDLLDLH